MLVKIGFVLLFVLFAAFVVLLGVFMQGDARGRLPGIEESLRDDAASPPARAAPVAHAAAPPEPAAAAAKGRYTLQLGLFQAQADADALTAQVEALELPGIKARTLAVRGVAGEAAWITAAGDQDQPMALESARVWLGGHFGLSDAQVIPMPVARP